MISDVAISVQVQGKPVVQAAIPVKQLSAEERGGRAFKVAGILAGIGLCSVFIPVVHFFLPWIMLTSAVVAYIRIRGQGGMVQASEVSCPNCTEAVQIPEQPATWPIDWNCKSCRKRLTLQLATPGQ